MSQQAECEQKRRLEDVKGQPPPPGLEEPLRRTKEQHKELGKLSEKMHPNHRLKGELSLQRSQGTGSNITPLGKG